VSSVKVGLIGLGTVGWGVARLLTERRSELRNKTGQDIVLSAVADLDPKLCQGLDLAAVDFYQDASELLARSDLDVVVELIGGIEPAKTFMLEALSTGRSLVTANKHLLAECLGQLSRAAQKGGGGIFCEAAVAGGIPILKSLCEGLVANRITTVMGIVNGTCNYILSEMSGKNLPFAEVLAAAQKAGYAETPPTLDIGGHDSAHKLVLLSCLAFGQEFKLEHVFVEGIEAVTSDDIKYAAEMGFVVKLVAIGRNSEAGVELRVHPVLLERNHPLASVDGVFNAVMLEADAADRLMFYGRGAGQDPTASAVVADIVDAARWKSLPADARPLLNRELPVGQLKPMADVLCRYFVRFSASDEFGVLGRVAAELGKNSVSIQEVIQKEKCPDGSVPIVMLTHPAREADFISAIKAIDANDFIKFPTAYIRAMAD
jgi:homoserine dehydrogenase